MQVDMRGGRAANFGQLSLIKESVNGLKTYRFLLFLPLLKMPEKHVISIGSVMLFLASWPGVSCQL